MIHLHFNAATSRAIPARVLDRALRALLHRQKIVRAEMSVTFVGDDAICALNQRHLGRSRPTDVIAFALHGPGEDPLGDIYIGHAQAIRQARALGIPEAEELVRLAIHGALHVLGHTHPDGADREAGAMHRLQEAVVRQTLDSPEAPDAPGTHEIPQPPETAAGPLSPEAPATPAAAAQ